MDGDASLPKESACTGRSMLKAMQAGAAENVAAVETVIDKAADYMWSAAETGGPLKKASVGIVEAGLFIARSIGGAVAAGVGVVAGAVRHGNECDPVKLPPKTTKPPEP